MGQKSTLDLIFLFFKEGLKNMNKAYSRINNGKGWKNYPSDETPLNEKNLNKQDVALDEIDNRVITLDTTKATKVEISTLFKEVSYNKRNGILTFTRKNGTTVVIDTPMEKIQTGIYYDPVSEMLTLPLIDGTQMEVDLSRLITEYEFLDSDTIAFSVGVDGKVSAIVKEGSIKEKHLRPDYLANIRLEASKAESASRNATAAATEAESNAKVSKSWAVGDTGTRPGENTDNSKYYYQQSKNIYENFSQAGTVTGVKGNAESAYRTGNVNLTAENIGALPINGEAKTSVISKGCSGTSEYANYLNVLRGNEIRFGGLNGKNDTIYMNYRLPNNELSETAVTRYKFCNGRESTESVTLQASEFTGNAASATKATQDGNGNVIADTYAKKEWIFLGSAGKGGGAFRYDATINGGDEFLLVIYIAPINDDIGFFETHYIPYDVFAQTAARTNGVVDYSIKIDNENVYNGSKVNVSFNRGYFIFTNNTGNCDMKIYAKK